MVKKKKKKKIQIKNVSRNISTISSQVSPKIAKKIPPTKNHFSGILKNPNNQTFIITTTTPEEVNDLISVIKTSKSTEPSSLPIKIMKQ